MRAANLLVAVALVFISCGPKDPRVSQPMEQVGAAPPAQSDSDALAANFPLLPIIEKTLWSQLLGAEAKLSSTSPSQREVAVQEVAMLTEKLRNRHPFTATGNTLALGDIGYDKSRGCFAVPAKVNFPDPGDERHPGEVELLLCSVTGRTHETLFITEARPLHLELLMHLAGYGKGPEGRRFRIDVLTRDGTRIPVRSLIRANGGEKLPSPLLWEFSGSDYHDLYSPDLSGDFAIFWHAHDSVLRVAHEGIASGEVKLDAVPHPALKNGDPVVLELVPLME